MFQMAMDLKRIRACLSTMVILFALNARMALLALLCWNGREHMRVLVTGGAGFLGSSLVEHLLDLDDEVVVLDNFWRGKPENLAYS